MKTAYDELGVHPDAHDKVIRTAYVGAARAWHPDLNSNDSDAEEQFKRINAAHDILKNPSRRAAYDRHLLQGRQRLRRERSLRIAACAGACLIGVSLAIGNARLLRRWSSREPLTVMSSGSVLAEGKPLMPTTRENALNRQPGRSGEDARDNATAMLAADARSHDLDATADEPGWPSPANPVATGRTSRSILSDAEKTMETQNPERGPAAEKNREDKHGEGSTVASRAVEASPVKTPHSSPARAIARRQDATHRRHDRPPVRLYRTTSLNGSAPRWHFTLAGPSYRLDFEGDRPDMCGRSAAPRIMRRWSGWQRLSRDPRYD